MTGQATLRFAHRTDAGQVLAALLSTYAGRDDVVVLGLPRGGVVVAAEVARVLGAPLDVLLVRKLGVPGQPELAMGAIAEDGVTLVNEDVLRRFELGLVAVDRAIVRERAELERRLAAYRAGRPARPVAGRVAIVVDDGLATGASMAAALRALGARGASQIIVAVPVAAREAVERLRPIAHDVVAARTPEPFHAVGEWYDDFTPTEDVEVITLLARLLRAADRRASSG